MLLNRNATYLLAPCLGWLNRQINLRLEENGVSGGNGCMTKLEESVPKWVLEALKEAKGGE